MRFLMVSLILASSVLAADTITGRPDGPGGGFIFPQTDMVMDSYAYNPSEVMYTLGASFGDYAEIDDFTYPYGSGFWLEYYFCWGVTTGSPPTELQLLCVADDGGVPSGAPISQVSYPTDCLNSGYTYAGYTIWVAEMYLLDNPYFDSPCWLGSHRADGGNWYIAGGTTVSGSEAYRSTSAGWNWQPISSTIEYGDLFKIFGNYVISLQRTTWAGVKSSF